MPDQIAANYQSQQLAERILAAANQILEPCGLAQGLSVGMVDMGLIRGVDVEHRDSGWSVRVRARVTSPDCLHFVYFERELRAAITEILEVAEINIEWTDGSDWTPDEMSDSLREQLKARRQFRSSAGADANAKSAG